MYMKKNVQSADKDTGIHGHIAIFLNNQNG